MALWGIFRVPDDGGPPVIEVPSPIRLALEAAVFTAATWLLIEAGRRPWAIVFALIVAAHYAVSYDRVLRLLKS